MGHIDLGGVDVGALERLTVRAEERAAGGEGEAGHPGRGRAYKSPRKARCWREVKREFWSEIAETYDCLIS